MLREWVAQGVARKSRTKSSLTQQLAGATESVWTSFPGAITWAFLDHAEKIENLETPLPKGPQERTESSRLVGTSKKK